MNANKMPNQKTDTHRVHSRYDTDRDIKLISILSGSALLLLIGTQSHHFDFVTLLVILLGFGCTVWFIPWVVLLLGTKELYRVHIQTGTIKNWMPISLPQKQKIHKNKAVLSISEISAIRGTHVHTIMHVMSVQIIILIAIVILYDLNMRGARFGIITDRNDVVLVLLSFTMLGLALLALFELNPFDKVHGVLHYTGVVSMMIGITSYGVQTNWSIMPIVLITAEFALIGLWVASTILMPRTSDSVAAVTRTSKVCVWLELGVFLINAIIIMLCCYGTKLSHFP